ncbi:MAG: tRNA threonylcarbamoyladenosine dehydratase [Erysipelothrix sp.]|nr:tRNA threonylcarbamoyladenosine dehydratase [Erysipelothrix sp.]
MFERVKLLLSDEGYDVLSKSTVLVIGVGGVGSIAVEALARSGIGKVIIVDHDTIALSNLNRQVQTKHSNVGQSKCVAMVEHIKAIHPDLNIEAHDQFFDEACEYLLDDVDFVIDAIDTISSKFLIMQMCAKKKMPLVTCLGMGNRVDPTKISVTTLDKTTYDPVAKLLRKKARRAHLNTRKFKVVYSSEQPIKQKVILNEKGSTRKQQMPPASMFIVPPTAGLTCAYYCIDTLLKNNAIL